MAGSVRIIAGKWRRRRLPVSPSGALRPTPDRVKETLFNWLGSRIVGARCLDLFAGTGALGLEAASRGAAHVTLVEHDATLATALRGTVASLGGGGGLKVHRADALRWLARPEGGPFDVVFLDPPFGGGLVERAAAAIDRAGVLAPGALVYVERAAQEPMPRLPSRWTIERSGRAGQVRYHLAAVDREPEAPSPRWSSTAGNRD